MVLGIYSNRVTLQLKKPNLLLKSLLLKTKTKKCVSHCRERNVRLSKFFQNTVQKIRLRKDQYLILVI